MKAEVHTPLARDQVEPLMVVTSVEQMGADTTITLLPLDEFQRRYTLAVPRLLIGDGLRLLWYNLMGRKFDRRERVAEIDERYKV